MNWTNDNIEVDVDVPDDELDGFSIGVGDKVVKKLGKILGMVFETDNYLPADRKLFIVESIVFDRSNGGKCIVRIRYATDITGARPPERDN